MITITEGRIFVEGKETTDPTLIGYALLDAAEHNEVVLTTSTQFENAITEVNKIAFNAGIKAGQIIETVGKHLNHVENDNR